MNRIAKGGAAAVLAASVIGGFEGYSSYAYPDPATLGPPWTICYGHTGNIKPYQRASLQECKALLQQDLAKVYAVGLESCVKPEVIAAMPDTRYVALLSFVYNEGQGTFCKSSIRYDLNADNVQGACDDFLKYGWANGRLFPGLVKRRQAERHLCLE